MSAVSKVVRQLLEQQDPASSGACDVGISQAAVQLDEATRRSDVRVDELLPPSTLSQLLEHVKGILSLEPTLVEISELGAEQEVVVVGDTHGHFHDVRHMMSLAGDPGPRRIYIFNGDFVDRGSWGLELMVLLLLWKAAAPKLVMLLRGNHESAYCTEIYGFQQEVKAKYKTGSRKLISQFKKLFAELPLAALVASNTLILHGGLFRKSPQPPPQSAQKGKKRRRAPQFRYDGPVELGGLSDLRSSQKGGNNPTGDSSASAVATDVLWSDPSLKDGLTINETRRVGLLFGPDVTQRFLSENNLRLVLRSHEGPDARDFSCEPPSDSPRMLPMDNGFTLDHDTAAGKLYTVFSAPDYPQHQAGDTERYANRASVAVLTSPTWAVPTFLQYDAVHPRPEAPAYYDFEDAAGSDEEIETLSVCSDSDRSAHHQEGHVTDVIMTPDATPRSSRSPTPSTQTAPDRAARARRRQASPRLNADVSTPHNTDPWAVPPDPPGPPADVSAALSRDWQPAAHALNGRAPGMWPAVADVIAQRLSAARGARDGGKMRAGSAAPTKAASNGRTLTPCHPVAPHKAGVVVTQYRPPQRTCSAPPRQRRCTASTSAGGGTFPRGGGTGTTTAAYSGQAPPAPQPELHVALGGPGPQGINGETADQSPTPRLWPAGKVWDAIAAGLGVAPRSSGSGNADHPLRNGSLHTHATLEHAFGQPVAAPSTVEAASSPAARGRGGPSSPALASPQWQNGRSLAQVLGWAPTRPTEARSASQGKRPRSDGGLAAQAAPYTPPHEQLSSGWQAPQRHLGAGPSTIVISPGPQAASVTPPPRQPPQTPSFTPPVPDTCPSAKVPRAESTPTCAADPLTSWGQKLPRSRLASAVTAAPSPAQPSFTAASQPPISQCMPGGGSGEVPTSAAPRECGQGQTGSTGAQYVDRANVDEAGDGHPEPVGGQKTPLRPLDYGVGTTCVSDAVDSPQRSDVDVGSTGGEVGETVGSLFDFSSLPQ